MSCWHVVTSVHEPTFYYILQNKFTCIYGQHYENLKFVDCLE